MISVTASAKNFFENYVPRTKDSLHYVVVAAADAVDFFLQYFICSPFSLFFSLHSLKYDGRCTRRANSVQIIGCKKRLHRYGCFVKQCSSLTSLKKWIWDHDLIESNENNLNPLKYQNTLDCWLYIMPGSCRTAN